MARLVEDLRTLSLSDAGKLTLSKQPLDLRKVVGRVASAFLAQAEEKGVELKLSGTE